MRPDPGGGKSGLQGSTVAANGRRGRPQGKCHREETAGAGQLVQARVKRCGKSAPRLRQRRRHGKPHREQDRIGAARMLGRKPGHPARSSPPPGLVARGTERSAPQRNGRRGETLSKQNPAYRPAGNCPLGPAFPEADAQRRLSGILPLSRQFARNNAKLSTRIGRQDPGSPRRRAPAGDAAFRDLAECPLHPRSFSWSYTRHK